MKRADATRYHSPLRTRQKEQTRNLILDAVDSVLRRANAVDITVADVAREAKVTERTIYRHFPTREDLLNASWQRVLRNLFHGQTQQVQTVEEIADLTRAAFKNFDENEGIVRAIIGSAAGAGVCKGPGQQRFDMLTRAYAGILMGASEDLLQAVVAATHALSSPSVWSHYREYCGLDGETGGEVSALAIELIAQAAKRRISAA